MKRIIFYSWQSDISSKLNRDIIENSLSMALKSLNGNNTDSLELVLDRDTSGIPGSPSISDTIFKKISSADIFVADVTIINKDSSDKKTANPNVLIELGFAVSQLGWDRIILVQNSYFGGPEDLPFDLRGRRVTTYSLSHEDEYKSDVRGLLQGRLESALRYALSDSSFGTLPTGIHAPIWWGEWLNHNPGRTFGGRLFIRETASSGFLFDLTVFSGSHTGQVTAEALYVSRDMAYAKIDNGPENSYGEISFKRRVIDGKKFLTVEETASCSFHRGMGVVFSGEFQWSSDHLFDLGFLNELELERIYNLLGDYYFDFKKRMEGIGECENLDTFQAKVFRGGIRGFSTYMEAIVMCSPHGGLWIAYLDENEVKYFTNDSNWKTLMPKTIEDWQGRFNNSKVNFISDSCTLPNVSL
ncbi:hypothetical protein [Aeromonas veronii]|uniref:hypothetical protein n=1 Tax=Aeromonas veronii TaxID=654 RepID=UPI003BA19727